MRDELYREQLKNLLSEYHLTLEALSYLTNISLLWFVEFLENKSDLSALSDDQLLTFNLTIEMFRVGITAIGDDERITVIMQLLIHECGLMFETFADYAHVSVEDVKLFLTHPEQVSVEVKYPLAVKTMFLFSLFKDCISLI